MRSGGAGMAAEERSNSGLMLLQLSRRISCRRGRTQYEEEREQDNLVQKDEGEEEEEEEDEEEQEEHEWE